MAKPETMALASSAYSIPQGSRAVRRTDPNRWIELTLGVRRRTPLLDLAAWEEIPPSQRMPIGRSDLAGVHGSDAEGVEAIADWAESCGLVVTREDPVSARLGLAGTAAGLSEAFELELFDFEHPELGEFHARTGLVRTPSDLAKWITGVFGFNSHPILRQTADIPCSAAKVGPWSMPPELARIYSCPAANVPGRTIGLVAFGAAGQTADVTAYFSRLGLARPAVQVVPGAAASARSAARPKIVVYFSTYDEKGLVDVLSTVVADAGNDPSLLSIGWGERAGPGLPNALAWSPSLIEHMAESFLAAAHLGISILADAGETPAGRIAVVQSPLWASLITKLKSMLYIERSAGGDTAELLAAFR